MFKNTAGGYIYKEESVTALIKAVYSGQTHAHTKDRAFTILSTSTTDDKQTVLVEVHSK